jgi:hypothetical protein
LVVGVLIIRGGSLKSVRNNWRLHYNRFMVRCQRNANGR